jgi:hypothetical protein
MDKQRINGTDASTSLYYAAVAIVYQTGHAHYPTRKNTQRINYLTMRLYESIRHDYIIDSMSDEGRLILQCAEAVQLALSEDDPNFTVTKQSRHWGKSY